MKSQKKGDATGRPNVRSSLLAHPGTKFFCGQRGLGTLLENDHGAGSLGEIFSFCFSSLAEQGRSEPAAVKGRAVFWRGGAHPLTARSAAKPSAREEKILYSRGRIFTQGRT